MTEQQRYPLRQGAVELTRRQWLSVASVLIAGLATAIVLLITISAAAGGIALGVTAVATALIIAFGRHPQPDKD